MIDYLYWKPYINECERIYTICPRDFYINGLTPLRGQSNTRLDDPIPFKDWEANNKAIYTNSEGKIADHLDTFHSRVISKRLKDYLEPLVGDEAQFMPLLLESRNTSETTENYWLMHVVAVVECLDLERMDYDPPMQNRITVQPWSQIVLRRATIPSELHVFRDPRWYGNDLIIRGDVVRALKRGKFIGLHFSKCEYS